MWVVQAEIRNLSAAWRQLDAGNFNFADGATFGSVIFVEYSRRILLGAGELWSSVALGFSFTYVVSSEVVTAALPYLLEELIMFSLEDDLVPGH